MVGQMTQQSRDLHSDPAKDRRPGRSDPAKDGAPGSRTRNGSNFSQA